MIRILIADDHVLIREGLKHFIGASGDMIVAGEAGDGAQLLKMIRQEAWGVLLLDMLMPGCCGVELIQKIKCEMPQLPILVLSMHQEVAYMVHALRAGADGYLCKDGSSRLLLEALRKVATGGHFISPEVAGDVAFGLIMHDEQLPHTLLSMRELQICPLLVAGGMVGEIALQLNLSIKTVSTYKTRILQKMHMSRIIELIRYGLKHGLLDDWGVSRIPLPLLLPLICPTPLLGVAENEKIH